MLKRLILLLLLALFAGQIVHAQDSTEVAPDCGSDTEQAFIARGDFKLQAEDWEGAIFEYTCAIALNPSNFGTRFSRGYSYYEIKKYDEAEVDYNAALEIDPTDGPTYNNRGNIYYTRGDYDRALADYNKAIEVGTLDPAVTYYNLANLKYEQGDYDDALVDVTQGLKINPGYDDLYLVRARIYQITGNAQSNEDYATWVTSIQKQTRTIDFTASMNDEIYPMSEGMVYKISIPAIAGQIILAAARTGNGSQVDTMMLLEAPSHKPVASDDDSGVNLDASLRYLVPEDGTYSLLVTHSNGGSEGDVKLIIALNGEVDTTNTASDFTDYHLAVNEKAVVYTTEGDNLNLRSGPGLVFAVVGKLSPDTVVTLLEGPRRASGLAWWRVRTADGVEGWAVERVDNEQTLQLALIVGEKALVSSTEGDTLRVRSGAGRSFDVIAQLDPGTVVTVLEGPQVVDKLSWWKIQTEDGLEGWAVERVEGDRTLTRQIKAEDEA